MNHPSEIPQRKDDCTTSETSWIFKNLPALDYHRPPGVSKSMLDCINMSPAHLLMTMKDKPKAEHFLIGSATDCAILEPDQFELRYTLAPECRRGTKEWKKEQDNAGLKTMLKHDQWDLCLAMRDAVYAEPYAAKLLTRNSDWAQNSVYWYDEETGILCKCRPDYLQMDWSVVVDLKTSANFGERAFARDARKWRYDVQDAFYTEGVEQSGLIPAAEGFVFVSVCKEPPHEVGVYEIELSDKDYAREICRENLRTYAECLRTDHWPKRPAVLKTVSLRR